MPKGCSLCGSSHGPFIGTNIIAALPHKKANPSARSFTLSNWVTGEYALDVTFPLELPKSPCTFDDLCVMLLEVFGFQIEEATVKVYTQDGQQIARSDLLLSDFPDDPTNHIQLYFVRDTYHKMKRREIESSRDEETKPEMEEVLLCRQCYSLVKERPFQTPSQSGACSSSFK